MSFSVRNPNSFNFSDLTANLKYLQPVAVGAGANATQGALNSIVLNASGSALTSSASGFYVAPVRANTASSVLFYNTSSKEVSYGPNNFQTALPNGVDYANYLFWNGSTWAASTSGKIHLGANAGQNSQGSSAVALGNGAGQNSQGTNAIALGVGAGRFSQGQTAIAIGEFAGFTAQSGSAVAIGVSAGNSFQGALAIAIGAGAGNILQGTNAIAIGTNSGSANQPANSIILNATGNAFNCSTSGFFVGPVRNTSGTANMIYNTTSGEFLYVSSSQRYKENIIDFESDTSKILEVRPREYDFKSNGEHFLGYIAEEVYDLDPHFAYLNNQGQPEGLEWNNMFLYLVEEVKKLKARLDALEKPAEAPAQ